MPAGGRGAPRGRRRGRKYPNSGSIGSGRQSPATRRAQARRAGAAVQADGRERLSPAQQRGAAGLRGRQATNRKWQELQRQGRQQQQRGQGGGGVSMSDLMVPSIEGGGVDPALMQAAAAAGISPQVMRQLGNPNVGNLIPLKMANRGAQTMGREALDALVSSLIGGSYERQQSILDQERARMEGQNAHNVQQIKGWYDQVLRSQGVAAERSREFGQAAVGSMTDATAKIVSALGGEANQGSYVVGAAGQENIGNLGAIATIQDQYNADIAPLLQAEAAGAMAREQAVGSERMRDLSMRLSELQAERSSDEANLRYNVWQQNNEILNQRLQNELGIRQANLGLHQQRFQNRMGLAQMGMAAQAAGLEAVGDAQRTSAQIAEANQRNARYNADRNARILIEQAREAGRNYRAQLPSGSTSLKPYGASSSDAKNSAYQDILNMLGEQEMSLQTAMRVASSVVSGYGWSSRNPAVRALMIRALRDAGYTD